MNTYEHHGSIRGRGLDGWCVCGWVEIVVSSLAIFFFFLLTLLLRRLLLPCQCLVAMGFAEDGGNDQPREEATHHTTTTTTTSPAHFSCTSKLFCYARTTPATHKKRQKDFVATRKIFFGVIKIMDSSSSVRFLATALGAFATVQLGFALGTLLNTGACA